MRHTLVQCSCERCERDRFEVRATVVIIVTMMSLAALSWFLIWL